MAPIKAMLSTTFQLTMNVQMKHYSQKKEIKVQAFINEEKASNRTDWGLCEMWQGVHMDQVDHSEVWKYFKGIQVYVKVNGEVGCGLQDAWRKETGMCGVTVA